MKKFTTGLVIGILAMSLPIAYALGAVFTDVVPGSWYEQSVNNMSSIGVIEGYSNGTFGPGNNVTRAELAVMLDRYNDFIAYNYEPKIFTYSSGNLSIDHPRYFMPYAAGYNPDITIFEDIDGGKIEVFAGNRPIGFTGEPGSPTGSSFVNIQIAAGTPVYAQDSNNNNINEYFFGNESFSIENGIGLIFFEVNPSGGTGQNYTVWAEYTSQEQKVKFLDILKTISVQ